MKPNSIYCGDCINVMRGWGNNCIDLTVTSPPYDNLRDYKGFVFDFETIARQLYRVTKQGGVVIWVVGDATIKGSETGTSFRQALYFKDIGFNLHDTMIYQKSHCPFPSINRYYSQFEYMFVFSKGKPKTVKLLQDRKNKHGGKSFGGSTSRQRNGTIKPMSLSFNKTGRKPIIKEYGVRWNVWQYHGQVVKGHPAPFPERLAADHIRSWSNEGDIVLDPMCGSGTTLKEAKKLNRQFIGIDVSEEYCNIANERLNA